MSEFTVGTLFLNRDQEAVETKLNEVGLAYKLRSLNDNWSAFFVEDEWLWHSQTKEQLYQVSRVAPILYFQNADDHGWAYTMLDQGKIVANVNVNYEREFNMTQEWAEQRYPNMDVIGELLVSEDPQNKAIWNAIRDEVLASDEYKQAEFNQFAQANVESFLRFDLTDEQITTLSNLLTVSYREQVDSAWDQVQKFKALLGIEEMNWLSYRYVDEDSEEFMHPIR